MMSNVGVESVGGGECCWLLETDHCVVSPVSLTASPRPPTPLCNTTDHQQQIISTFFFSWSVRITRPLVWLLRPGALDQ